MNRRIFLQQMALCSTSVMALSNNHSVHIFKDNKMDLNMIYNNTGSSSTLQNGWGLSVWIQRSDDAVLFDTGGDSSILWDNIQQSGLNPGLLSKIVISHNHWDHTNGLGRVLKETKYKPAVYVPAHDNEEFQRKHPQAMFQFIKEAQKLDDDLWTTGQMTSSSGFNHIYEQALVIVQHNNVNILTGCSHPGIVEIVHKAGKIFPGKTIELVAGGFHLMNKTGKEVRLISEKIKKTGVQHIAPSHCTGERAIQIFRETWRERFVDFNLHDHRTI